MKLLKEIRVPLRIQFVTPSFLSFSLQAEQQSKPALTPEKKAKKLEGSNAARNASRDAIVKSDSPFMLGRKKCSLGLVLGTVDRRQVYAMGEFCIRWALTAPLQVCSCFFSFLVCLANTCSSLAIW
jgi:hypothetical protein